MSNYFDPLADEVSAEVLQAAHDAMTAHIHHGAGRLEDSTLLHGVRALLAAVRAEERARAEAVAEGRHQVLKRHYHALQQEVAQSYASAERTMITENRDRLQAHARTWDYLLSLRSRRAKTVRITEIATRMNLPLEGWGY